MLRRRSPLRAKPRRDRVTPEMRDFILARDRRCVAASLDVDHECRDAWGTPHSPDETYRLSIEHVKDEPRMGFRATSDADHMVAVCYGANLYGWASKHRRWLRLYLALIRELPRLAALEGVREAEGIACSHVEPVHGCTGPCQRRGAA